MAAPSIQTQKNYIIQHSNLLDRATKDAILALVLVELDAEGPEPGPAETGPESPPARRPGVTDARGGVDIDLDLLGRRNPALVLRIHNMVLARVRALSVPAGAPGGAPAPGRGGGSRAPAV
ncbi:MAG TPA: hypothetical protein VNI01_03240 [Elusimicrobiota bacterium]|jgi:hypothetical protein|nr:hypothetical protein [Elusimicrobiota bacterium]